MKVKKKRVAAIAALYLILIMSVLSQQRVAAKSFCDCYQPCHDKCNQSVPWWRCKVDCVENCKAIGYREESLAACLMVCSNDFACHPSVAPTNAEGVAECKTWCYKRWCCR
ncbi:hypothetical protein ZWY2020_015919 [Hordeum vulgare]|nr:hypothetical protein ZWY2020_015919 [Hordeum vulgare]